MPGELLLEVAPQGDNCLGRWIWASLGHTARSWAGLQGQGRAATLGTPGALLYTPTEHLGAQELWDAG